MRRQSEKTLTNSTIVFERMMKSYCRLCTVTHALARRFSFGHFVLLLLLSPSLPLRECDVPPVCVVGISALTCPYSILPLGIRGAFDL